MECEEELDPGRVTHRIAKEKYRKRLCIECGLHPIAPGERREDRLKDDDRIPSFVCALCLDEERLVECGKCLKEFCPVTPSQTVAEVHKKWRCFHCLTWGPRSAPKSVENHNRCGTCRRCGCGCGVCKICQRCHKEQRREKKYAQKLRDKIKAVIKQVQREDLEQQLRRKQKFQELKAAKERFREACEMAHQLAAEKAKALHDEIRQAQKRKDEEEEREEEEEEVGMVMDEALLALVKDEVEEKARTQKAKQEAEQATEEVRQLQEEADMLEAELDLDDALDDEEEENECANSVLHLTIPPTATTTSSMSNSGACLDLTMRSSDGSTRSCDGEGDRSEANSERGTEKGRDVCMVQC
uniref:Uncharacterized protein n=1 Tax=Chromera velia CCMP2878 TaxID=1169474 RepID=A0A0G4HHN9_9ALVE|eukprot:Cvel_6845.t1-p1 / transcript=Cvel_6845.t1 / gene=Cvel_6845 / organism=Chromera_velia_CCMP2878 / gene_product=hypothetical protein / transcript_product=hypothetical protein / location=Cvel_scaffold345:58361-61463(+) / protein_length=355 / sequence_SO=supercontig / SO=protein_coding / is_pseudo=false